MTGMTPAERIEFSPITERPRLELPDGRQPVTVPMSRREVDPKTLGSVLRQAGLSVREFVNAAEEIL